MLGRISEWLQGKVNGWVALVGLVVFLLFSALVLPGQSAQTETYSGDAGSPDMSLLYSTGDLYQMAETYGEEGRQSYVRARLTFDVAFPLVFTLFLTTAITWLTAKGFAAGSPGLWRGANLVPLLGGLFDYLENGSTALVMARYPLRTPIVDRLAPLFTLLKWLLVGGSILLLVVAGAVALYRWGKRGKGES
jgi:hypothetical protein